MKKLIKKIYHNKIFSCLFPTLISVLSRELGDCDRVLDLGCGPSSPIQYCKNIKFSTGVEVFKPYLECSRRKGIHDEYINQDITKIDFPKGSYDAVIMIEVLEHMDKEQGMELIKKANQWAKKKVILSTPNGFVDQMGVDGNEKQRHLSGWKVSELKKLGFRVSGLAGLKYLRKEYEQKTLGDDLTASIKFKPKLLWLGIAALSQMLIYYLPEHAFELFCVRKK